MSFRNGFNARSAGADATETWRIRLQHSSQQLAAVHGLVRDAYRQQGYWPETRPVPAHFESLDTIPATRILLAHRADGELQGTVSVTRQNPQGMPIFPEFMPAYERVLQEYGDAAVIWRLAVRAGAARQQPLVARLIRASIQTVAEWGVPVSLSVVSQAQVPVYQRICGMTVVESREGLETFPGLPVALLKLDLSSCPGRWLKTQN